MNTYDKRTGIKAIGTGIGAAVYGPIGASIGNIVGTLAGSLLFKPKTFQTKEVNFDTNIDPSLAFREDDFGKGYNIGYRMDQEKPTGFSNVLSTATDLAPQAMSATGITTGLDFKGMSGGKDSFVDPLNKPLNISTDIDKSLKSLFQEGKSGSSFGGAKIEGLGNTGVTKTVVDPIFGDSMKPLDFGTSIDNLLTKKMSDNTPTQIGNTFNMYNPSSITEKWKYSYPVQKLKYNMSNPYYNSRY